MVTQINIEKAAAYAKGVNVYIDGEEQTYPVGSPKFEAICLKWEQMLEGAHKMPAFGVSLNGDTAEAMKQGVWAEFFFGGEYSSDGMPFEKLLIAVRAEWSGFNIVRYTAERGYEGRCFYFSLAGDMSAFYGELIK